MRFAPVRSSLLALLLLIGATSPSQAGLNKFGRVKLSWDEAGVVRTLSGAPAQRFPLYVHLDHVPDIRKLAIHLAWSSYDSVRTYRAVRGEQIDDCGWVSSDGTLGAFGNDSTYDWRIAWRTGLSGDTRCIAYTIETPDSAAPPVTDFFLQRVLVMDSFGNVDTLRAGQSASVGNERLPTSGAPEQIEPGVVLVKFEQGAASSDTAQTLGINVTNATVRDVMTGLGLQRGRRIFRTAVPADTLYRTKRGEVVKVPDLSTWYKFKLPAGADPAFVASALKALPGVRGAKPGHIYQLSVLPNDPDRFSQWHIVGLAGTRAPEAWDITKGRPDIRVGVIDTGVDYNHLDLDPDNRTHVIQGWDTAENDSDPLDDTTGDPVGYSHGTACAGLIGALTDNSRQVAGLLWNCEIDPWKAAQSDGGALHDSDIADALNRARQAGDDVISMSFGTAKDLGFWENIAQWFNTDPICEASYAAYLSGCVQVGANGENQSGGVGEYARSAPGGYDWVMCVNMSTSPDSTIDPRSDFGPWVDVAGPGVNVLTTWRGNQTNYFSGTSAATPVVAGVAGLVIAAAADSSIPFSNDDVVGLIQGTARDQGAVGKDDFYGWGIIDARAAVQRLRPPYSMLRQGVTGGGAAKIWDNREITIYNRYGNVSAGKYWADVYEVTQHITFPLYYNATPLSWGRSRDSYGFSLANPVDRMYSGVRNVTPTGCDLVTYCLHDLISQADGRHYNDWVPCPPQNVTLSYTVNGIVPLQNGLVTGTHGSCSLEQLSMSHAGGSGAVTYAWQWRRAADTQWSGTVGTQKTYTPTWTQGDAYVVQCTASNNGVAVADTHFVYYAPPCVVGVGDAPVIASLEMACSPNPLTAEGKVVLRMPLDAQVAIECIDIAGRVVGKRTLGLLRAGQHDVNLMSVAEANSLPNGVYFVRARIGQSMRTVRVAVMK